MTLATYSSSYKPWTPSILLPEIDDSITWDWYDSVSQFSQRLTKIATQISTVSYRSYATFDYSSLGCDYFPPIIKAYYFESTWRQFDFATTIMGVGSTSNIASFAKEYVNFQFIGLASCVFFSNVNKTLAWKFIAYM